MSSPLQRLADLSTQVPQFNRTQDTYFEGKDVNDIPAPFNTVYDQLENHLNDIRGLINQIKNFLTKETTAEQQNTIQAALFQLQSKAQELNAFLIEHASDRGSNKGLSLLSSINPENLIEIAAFAETLLRETNAKSSRSRAYNLTRHDIMRLIVPLYPPLWRIIKTTWHNRKANTVVGGKFKLRSDDAILKLFDREFTVTIHDGNWLHHTHDTTLLTDNEGNLIVLPAYAVDSQDPKAKGFSVAALAREVFPKDAEDRITSGKNGRVIFVTWKNKQEKQKWLGALRKRNLEYLKWKEKKKDLQATLSLPNTDAKDNDVEAVVPMGSPTTARRPGFTNTFRKEPSTAEESSFPPQIPGTGNN